METDIRPPTTMAAMIRPLLRCSGLRDNSSIANMIPPSGVLNAAAMPAAPPAISSPWSDTTPRLGFHAMGQTGSEDKRRFDFIP